MRAKRVTRDFVLLTIVALIVVTLFAIVGRVRAAYGAEDRATVSAAYFKQSVRGQVARFKDAAVTIRRLTRENRKLRVRANRDLSYYLRLGADLFHIDRGLLASVIWCESHNYQYAKNRSSTASGYGQWLDSTWASSGLANFSVFDGLANVLATARLISQGGISHWNASRGCWG